jgi:transposase
MGCCGAAWCPHLRSGSCGILTRYRKRLIQAHGAEGQRIQRPSRTPASSRVSVATDVLGVSGRAILKALVAGERDPRS